MDRHARGVTVDVVRQLYDAAATGMLGEEGRRWPSRGRARESCVTRSRRTAKKYGMAWRRPGSPLWTQLRKLGKWRRFERGGRWLVWRGNCPCSSSPGSPSGARRNRWQPSSSSDLSSATLKIAAACQSEGSGSSFVQPGLSDG